MGYISHIQNYSKQSCCPSPLISHLHNLQCLTQTNPLDGDLAKYQVSQCLLHFPGWLLSSFGRRCQVLSLLLVVVAVLVLAFTMTSHQKAHFFWMLLIIFILSLITMLLLIWYVQGTLHKFRYPHTCDRMKEPICLQFLNYQS